MKLLTQTNKRTKLAGGLASIVTAALAYGASAYADAADAIGDGVDATGDGGTSLNDGVEIVTNILLFLIGLVAVIMIIIGGIRYTTSNGDASQTKAAKDTILYSVVGLIVAIMAYAIVRWVVDAFM